VKETGSVGRPHFDDDSAQGYVTVDVDPGRDFGSETIFVTKESAAIGLLSLFVNQVVGRISLKEKGLDGIFESLACLDVVYDSSSPIFDVKDVYGQTVLSRDGSGTENVDAGHGKGPGDFLKDSLAVTGYDVHDREGSPKVVSPTYDRSFRILSVFLKAVNHVDVESNFLLPGVGKITDGDLFEVVEDFFLGDPLNLHIPISVLQGAWVFSGVLAFQNSEGVGEELSMELLLVVVP
jgi:hypothetical protein